MRSILLLLLALPGLAHGTDYVAAPGSTLAFRASFQGEPTDIRFARFAPAIRFDPAHLDTARFDVAIDLASVATGQDDGDSLVRGEDFFATAKFPQARYTATKVRALGNGRYAADGALSLRGVSKPATLEFRWTPGPKPMLDGQARLKRLDFGISAGEFGSEIGNEVQVSTRLVLLPAPAAKAAAKPAAAPKR